MDVAKNSSPNGCSGRCDISNRQGLGKRLTDQDSSADGFTWPSEAINQLRRLIEGATKRFAGSGSQGRVRSYPTEPKSVLVSTWPILERSRRRGSSFLLLEG